jgi:hypothetical protein
MTILSSIITPTNLVTATSTTTLTNKTLTAPIFDGAPDGTTTTFIGAAGALLAVNDLSDVANGPTALVNIGGAPQSTTYTKTEVDAVFGDSRVSDVVSTSTVTGSSVIANGTREISISFSSETYLTGNSIASFDIDYKDGSAVENIIASADTGSSTHTFPTDEVEGTTLDITVTAIDTLGNKSREHPYTLTYLDNSAPTGTVVPDFNATFFSNPDISLDYPVTFSGASDSDGTVLSYKVSDISNAGITVGNAVVSAGSAHIFTIAANAVAHGDPDVSFTYTVSALDNYGAEGASIVITATVGHVPDGESTYTTAGTYSWVAPSGVTEVSIITVDGGSSGGRGGTGGYTTGGRGGTLKYENNITVVPGNSYSLTVGDGGLRGYSSLSGDLGGDTTMTSLTSTMVIGGFGGSVGNGSDTFGGGGSGAGGYSGNGGHGAYGGGQGATGANGSGGGGGGGGYNSAGSGSGGGGVGLFGQGSNGAGGDGSGAGNQAVAGKGGSGGNDGINDAQGTHGGDGGINGGGGGAGYGSGGGGGGTGAVRIMWGTGRSFPTNAT